MVQIIIDSTTDLRPGLQDAFTVVPLTLRFGDEEYVDGVTITHEEFYNKLVESDVLPTTSQAAPAVFAEVFEQVIAKGDTAVMLPVSAKLSGTCQSAMIAAEDYPGRIFVVDTNNVTIGAGILAERALQLRDAGKTAAEIAEIVEAEKKDLHVVALLDTLEYLKKGGRISSVVAFAGGLLNIKPVVAVVDGAVQLLGKARGSRQGNNYLAQEIEKAGGVDFSRPVLLGYSGISDHLLLKYLEDSASLWQGLVDRPEYTSIGVVVGTHVGPGAIAVAFFAPQN